MRLACVAWLLVACSTAEPATDPVVLRDGLPVCSGVALDSGRILTAAHCVDDRQSIAVVTAEQWRTTAKAFSVVRVTAVDAGRDLAFLSGPVAAQVLNQREPMSGEVVHARSGLYQRSVSGFVLVGAGFFRDTTLSVEPGWSGSPVFAADGSLVGIVHSCVGGYIGVHKYCTPNNAAIAVMQ